MQSLTVGTTGSKMSARQTAWSPASTPSYEVSLLAGDALTITLSEGVIGDVEIDGDLEEDSKASSQNARVLRWSSNARESKEGEATITITNAQSKLKDVSLSVQMSDETASLSVSVAEPKQKPYTGIDLVDRYAAYGLAGLAALTTLVFALLMPSHHAELVTGAGSIAVFGFWCTEEYDSYVVRILAFVAAFAVMVFACLSPTYQTWAIDAAASICAAGIYWGGEDFDEVKDYLPFWPF